MRSTCLGARSGRSSMTTRPLVVSMTSVVSGSGLAMSCLRCCRWGMGSRTRRPSGGGCFSHMPAHAGRIDDVDLTAPGIFRRLLGTHTGKAFGEALCRNRLPVGIEIVDLDNQHLV